jgi:hypothetical protein
MLESPPWSDSKLDLTRCEQGRSRLLNPKTTSSTPLQRSHMSAADAIASRSNCRRECPLARCIISLRMSARTKSAWSSRPPTACTFSTVRRYNCPAARSWVPSGEHTELIFSMQSAQLRCQPGGVILCRWSSTSLETVPNRRNYFG